MNVVTTQHSDFWEKLAVCHSDLSLSVLFEEASSRGLEKQSVYRVGISNFQFGRDPGPISHAHTSSSQVDHTLLVGGETKQSPLESSEINDPNCSVFPSHLCFTQLL